MKKVNRHCVSARSLNIGEPARSTGVAGVSESDLDDIISLVYGGQCTNHFALAEDGCYWNGKPYYKVRMGGL